MKGYDVLMSSEEITWSTPQWLFDELHKEFNFTLDVCAQISNAKCLLYFSPEINGLKQKWEGTVWMNPPYGKAIYEWVQKAYETATNGHTVVCLLPARTDTKWFHDFCIKGENRWIKGRLKFGNAKNPAPFPSFICVFDKLGETKK